MELDIEINDDTLTPEQVKALKEEIINNLLPYQQVIVRALMHGHFKLVTRGSVRRKTITDVIDEA